MRSALNRGRGLRPVCHHVLVTMFSSLGCVQLRYVDEDYNRFGLPTSFDRYEAVSVKVGEPDSSLFQIPSGYRRVESIYKK
jgi:hypothetical protein